MQQDQLAHLSEPVRDCLLKAARLCESSRAGHQQQRAQPDVPIDSMLQLVMGLDAPSALSCLTQMYAPPSSQQPSSLGHEFDGSTAALPNLSTGLPASLPPNLGNALGSGGSSGGGAGALNGAGGFNGGGPPPSITASFLQPGALAADVGTGVSAASSSAGRTSISQMSSQLRALVEEREPAATAGPAAMRRNLTPEEQLASLLGASGTGGAAAGPAGAPGTLPAMPPAQPPADFSASSVLGHLHSKDALSALFASGVDAGSGQVVGAAARGAEPDDGGGDGGGGGVSNLGAAFSAQRLLDGARDSWPSLPMQNAGLLDDHAGHAAGL